MTAGGGLKDSRVSLQQGGILKKKNQTNQQTNKPLFGVALTAFFLYLLCVYVKTSGFYFY